jgi:hypothetical protein
MKTQVFISNKNFIHGNFDNYQKKIQSALNSSEKLYSSKIFVFVAFYTEID